jgi:hypothetical protein
MKIDSQSVSGVHLSQMLQESNESQSTRRQWDLQNLQDGGDTVTISDQARDLQAEKSGRDKEGSTGDQTGDGRKAGEGSGGKTQSASSFEGGMDASGVKADSADGAAGTGQTSSTEERIQELEQKIKEVEQEIIDLRAKARNDPEAKEQLRARSVELTSLQSQLAELESQQAQQAG